jgi:tripartite-type tricarboxylate transporter receptor subunit TctC
MTAMGAEAGGDTPQAFSAFVNAESARWGRIIKERGIRPE